jgi:hypothetical protein
MEERLRVEKAFKDLGIKIKRFRRYKSTYSILNSLSKKWNKLTKDDKEHYSKEIAGDKDAVAFRHNMDQKTT